jgi:hypothetical protein
MSKADEIRKNSLFPEDKPKEPLPTIEELIGIITCAEAGKLIPRLNSETEELLAESERAKLIEHITSCPECAKVFQDTKKQYDESKSS